MAEPEARHKYWRANLRIVASCLAIWFVVSFGFSVLFVDTLNQVRFFGFDLGFWLAQQGSILVFIGLIFYYAWRMNHLDREHDVDED